jgi:hypothetical protein
LKLRSEQAKVLVQLKRLQQACTLDNWDAALAKLKEVAGTGFWAYFNTNRLHDGWLNS